MHAMIDNEEIRQARAEMKQANDEARAANERARLATNRLEALLYPDKEF